MFWDKKDRKDGLPDLPALKMPKFPEERKEERNSLPDLPSFSSNPLPREHDTEKATSRVIEEEDEESLENPAIPHWAPEQMKQEPQEIMPETRGNIFVKLERFQTAKKTIYTIEQKIGEIDSTLKKIRETRMREEQELTTWEREVAELKTRIESVSKSLFEKLG